MQFCSIAQFLPLCGNRKTVAFVKFPSMSHAGEGTAVFSIVGLCKSYISSFAYSISPYERKNGKASIAIWAYDSYSFMLIHYGEIAQETMFDIIRSIK